MQISEIARRARLRASAIRYYERVGLLPPARRVSGQRRYDENVLGRLATIERARQCGFALGEIRQLFFGFREDVLPSARWKKLAMKKVLELEELAGRIRMMKTLLLRWQKNCHCGALVECGQRLLLKSAVPAVRIPNTDVKPRRADGTARVSGGALRPRSG